MRTRRKKANNIFLVGVVLLHLTTMAVLLLVISDPGRQETGQPTPEHYNFQHIP